MRIRDILLFAGILLSFQISAQEKYERIRSDEELVNYPYWIDMMQDPHANFFETQHAFEVYWKNRTNRKGAGWKPFKRWENFMESRVSETGVKPAAQEIWTAVQYEMSMQASSVNSGSWTELGPIALPANGTGQPNGLGRVNCIAFHPTNADTFFVGAPAGGIWKTYDGGSNWSSNSDNLSTLGISSILINYNSPDTMYIGTGDRDGGDAVSLGVFLSTDGGDTWTSSNSGMGNLTVGALLIDPSNSSILLAATSGGVYRSADAGASWTNTITGNFKDIRFMPGNSSVVYATKSGDFYRSSDNGLTWTLIGVPEGLPSSSRLVIGVTPADSSYVYALLTSGSVFQGMYQSVDSGLTFSVQSTTPNIMDYSSDGSGTNGQAWYDLCIAVSPTNKNVVYAGGINVFKSSDGGQTWLIDAHWVGTGAPAVHADHHVLEYSPVDQTLYSGNDGGVYYQEIETITWTDISSGLAIAQCYKLGQSATSINHVIVGYQDNGTAVYSNGSWSTEIGGDGMECIIDYTTTDYMYGELYYGAIRRSSNGGLNFSSIAGLFINGITESGAWVTPYTLHSTNPNTMFIGYKDIWRSTNVKTSSASSVSWTEISTDLGGSGNFNVVEHNPLDTNVFYASKGASLFRSDNVNGGSVIWQTLSSPGTSSINYIVSHPTDTSTVFIAQGTKVYQSVDKGVNWTDISGNIDDSNIKNCLVYSPNIGSEGLYVGTDYGVYFKPLNSSNWISFSSGLPVYPKITELELFLNDLSPSQNSLRASSYGRGLWSTSIYVDPNTPLVVDFYTEDTVGCLSTIIELIDGTAGVPDAWLWSISPNTFSYVDGTDSTSQYPKLNFSAEGLYSVSLIVSNSTEVDTILKTNYISINQGEQLFLELLTDNYGSESSWILADTSGTQIVSGAGYSNNTLYNITLDCLVDSCYTFTIYDSFGDGICCSYGTGHYIVTNLSGDTVASGGSFNYSEATAVCFIPILPYLDCDSAIDLTCGQIYSGTTTASNSDISTYSCSVFDESGPENIHSFSLSSEGTVNIDLSTSEDLNIYILNACHQDSCIAYGDSTVVLNNLAAGSYYIVVDGTNGASGNYDLQFSEEVNIEVSASSNQVCDGDTSILIATGASSYVWTPSFGLNNTSGDTVLASPVSTTTYIVTGTTNGCSDVDSLTIVVNAIPTVTISTGLTNLCLGDSTLLNVSGADNYNWSPSLGLNTTSGNSVIASPLVTTTYTVTGISSGCSSIDTITIFVNDLPDVSVSVIDSILCVGDSTVLTASGADNYVWTPSVGLNTDTGEVVIASPSVSTIYTVTGSSNNCISVDSVIIEVNPIPDVSASASVESICLGDSSQLSVIGADSFTWSPSIGLNTVIGASVTASPNTTTTYTVIGTTNGCSSVDTITIEVVSFPIIDISSDNSSLCIGDSAIITASGADSYVWSPAIGLNSISGATVIANPASTTTYTVTGSINGCSSIDSVTIEVFTVPTVLVSSSSSSICFGDSSLLIVTGADSYVWFPSTGLNVSIGNSVVASPDSTTTYTVTGSVNGCTAIDTVTIEVNEIPMVSISSVNSILCLGDSVILSASGADSYSWSPGGSLDQTTGNIVIATPTETTTYFVTGTTNGCSFLDSILIEVVLNSSVVISPVSASICVGDSVLLSVTGANVYSWEPSIGLSTSIGSVVYASPLVSTSYIVEGSINGCISWDTVFVEVNSNPVVEVNSVNNSICFGDTTTLTANGADSFIWTPSIGLISDTGSTVIANPGLTTTYVVTGQQNGCEASDTITVVVFPELNVEVSSANSSICIGDTASLFVSGANSYTWTPSIGLNVDTGNMVMASPSQTTTYIISGQSNGCISLDTITLEVIATPSIILNSENSSICVGDTVMLTAQGADSYVWSPDMSLNNTVGDTVFANPSVTTSYVVFGTTNGCSSVDSIEIVVNDLPILEVNIGNAIICRGGTTTLAASGADTYSWNLLNGTQVAIGDSILVAPEETSFYVVSGVINGCTVLDTVLIEVLDILEIQIFTDVNIIYLLGNNNTVNFESNGDSSLYYTWLFGDGDSSLLESPSHDYYTSGLYTVLLQVIDSNSCLSMDSTVIEVLNNISLEELDSLDWVDIFPNPSTGIIQLVVKNTSFLIDEITVYDVRGRQVFRKSIGLTESIMVDITDQQDGYYILAFKVGESVYTKMVQKRSE